jgi:hypothetical protein
VPEETFWTIQVLLSNGVTRQLARPGSADEATARLVELEEGEGEFRAKWLRTTDATLIATAHIVEAAVVDLP